MRQAQPQRTVSVLAYDGMTGFETGIVTEVFGLPRPSWAWTGTS
jgi:AraC family transcriptional activator FtrA